MRRTLTISVILLIEASTACAPMPNTRVDARTCSRSELVTMRGVINAEALAGTYRVVVVGTNGSGRGRTSGSLHLEPPLDSARRFVTQLNGQRNPRVFHPLFGATTVNFEKVGALFGGGAASTDPNRPGVMVQESHGADSSGAWTDVSLSIGSWRNSDIGQRTLDGGSLSLSVAAIDATGFRGVWQDGVFGPTAAGYFCAYRKSE